MSDKAELFVFWPVAVLLVASAIGVVRARNPVYAAMSLVAAFFLLAGLYLMLTAHLVAFLQIMVYAGAIMVLFLFVIMMLDLGHPDKAWRPHLREWWPALLLGGIVAGAVLTLATTTPANGPAGPTPDIKAFSQALFQKYGVAVEIISMQLLFAVVGALYLGRRRR